MNSKKKNKNRQNKPPNPTPPQKQEVSEPSSPPEVTNTEVESVIEDRVPNIVCENVTTEVKETEETPKKPKRNRGKKKKEDERSDKEEEVKIEEPTIPETGLPSVIDSLNEANITPTTRKKKNKNKKGQGQGEPIEETEIEKHAQLDHISEQPQEITVTKTEEPEPEIKPGKKKNKKKKNRNDSEKSDKAEEITCTSAFQKLLADDGKAKPNPPASTDDSHISETTVKEAEILPEANLFTLDILQRDEGNKNKKKNKKAPTDPALPKAAEQTQPLETKAVENTDKLCNVLEAATDIIAQDTVQTSQSAALPSTSTADEQNSKQKAKIAKPVDKKKKGKGNDKKSEENVETEESVVKCESVEEVKVSEIEAKQVASVTETEDLDDVILVPLTEITPDWQEEVKIEEGNGPVIGCDLKTESVALEQPISNLEKKKNRKKSPKRPSKTETQGTSGISSVTSQFQKMLPEISNTSSEPAIAKPDVKPENNPEIQLEEKDKVEHMQVITDTEKRHVRKTSPKPSKGNELPPTAQISAENLSEISTRYSGNIMPDTKLEDKQDDQVEVKLETPSLEEKKELVQAASSNQKKNRKKSPKPRKIHEAPISIMSPQIESELTPSHATTLPINCPGISSLKTKEILETKHDAETTESQKDEIERIKTPDSEKRQKIKKSPKPIVDVASGSKDTQKSGQNVVNIEDIIIIQADIVSEEKAQKSDTEKDLTDTQHMAQKINVKRETENSKKRKKSPKPPQRDSTKEGKDDTDQTRITESKAEIQMPVTPVTQDKMVPNTFAVELETPKLHSMPSPSDATPDFIEYPRCSSEHLDSNNNMIIQDISHSDNKLEVPLVIPDTPFIQSTTIDSPDLATSAVKVIDKQSGNKPIEEKTDLKSKVMEVNQDMEELRLSIERSLAELTSMDKADKDAESKPEVKNPGNTEITKNTEDKPESHVVEKVTENVPIENVEDCMKPICPARKDHKGKGKSKHKKGKQELETQNPPTQSSQQTTTDSEKTTQSQDTKKEDSNKTEQKSDDAQGKAKQQSAQRKGNKDDDLSSNDNNENNNNQDLEPIENFEDAMTSSVDDVNKTFEMIVNEVNPRLNTTLNNPEINVIAPQEDDKDSRQVKQSPVSPPKNLLGHPDIPVPSSRTDYKKEKNKPPNTRQAKVKIKDANQVQIEIPEKSKESKESQTESKRKFLNYKSPDESICVTNQNDDYVYKYSFRKVFLQSTCHVCKKDLKERVPCSYCNLIFYCNQKHKDEDYAQHQALCFAVSTIVHLKDQKFIYADARDITGHNYRLLRMQMIVSCEKVLKRRLAPWEQEALLYPRMCGTSSCREWRQGKLTDCEGCGQISYCSDNPDHLPKTHSRWCKSYNLYRALVKHQQTQGRVEPKLPTKVVDLSPLPDNINEVLASMYEEKIDMSDIEYAALTQIATAPLTVLFCLQHRPKTANGITKKTTLTVHIVGAELQFEADVLNKWEVFLLHLLPDVKELRVVLVGPDLNPSNLPLELLGKIKLCENCRQNRRRVVFGFQDKRTYHEFWASEDFTAPDLVCAFNPSIQRSSTYNGKDTWPSSINCILKLKTLFAITSYTLSELTSDLLRVQECAGVGYNVVLAPKNNSFSSVRPDRNFISDDEAPLLFKNHCVTVVCGV